MPRFERGRRASITRAHPRAQRCMATCRVIAGVVPDLYELSFLVDDDEPEVPMERILRLAPTATRAFHGAGASIRSASAAGAPECSTAAVFRTVSRLPLSPDG